VATDSVAADSVLLPVVLVGHMVDEMNNPLAGATVAVAGDPTQLCITNAEDRYLVEIPRNGADVAVAFHGYQTQVLRVNGQPEQGFVLLPRPEFKRDRKARVIYRRLHQD
jgi:hypothetical protein